MCMELSCVFAHLVWGVLGIFLKDAGGKKKSGHLSWKLLWPLKYGEHPTAIGCHDKTFRRNHICVSTPKIDVVKEGRTTERPAGKIHETFS